MDAVVPQRQSVHDRPDPAASSRDEAPEPLHLLKRGKPAFKQFKPSFRNNIRLTELIPLSETQVMHSLWLNNILFKSGKTIWSFLTRGCEFRQVFVFLHFPRCWASCTPPLVASFSTFTNFFWFSI